MNEAIEMHHAAERAYAEQERRHRLVMDARNIGERTIVPFDPETRGALTGFAAGVKPGVVLGEHEVRRNELIAFFRGQGIDADCIGEALVNRTLLARRLESEPDVARAAGWNNDLSFDQNVARASAITTSSPDAQALMGLVLGFPASVLSGHREHLRRRAEEGLRKRAGVGVRILDPWGETVYVFKRYDEDGSEPEDVRELRAQVRRAYADAGFVEKEKTPPD